MRGPVGESQTVEVSTPSLCPQGLAPPTHHVPGAWEDTREAGCRTRRDPATLDEVQECAFGDDQ